MFYSLKHLPKLASLSVVLALATACDNGSTGAILAPPTETMLQIVSQTLITSPTSASSDTTIAGNTVVTFTVTSRGGMYNIGDHKIVFPTNVVCDPLTSGYGPSYWNQPCNIASYGITITAIVGTDRGHPKIDFSPALRFVTNGRGQSVILYMKDAAAQGSATATIMYCNPLAGCVDESLTDPTLVTKKDARGGFLYRILKHFSGYNVWA